MTKPIFVNPKDTLKIPGIFVRTDTFQVFVGKKEVDVTLTELHLLVCFLGNPGKVLSRDTLFEKCGMCSIVGSARSVDTHIQRLRRKLGVAGYRIKTVRGVGYRLEK